MSFKYVKRLYQKFMNFSDQEMPHDTVIWMQPNVSRMSRELAEILREEHIRVYERLISRGGDITPDFLRECIQMLKVEIPNRDIAGAYARIDLEQLRKDFEGDMVNEGFIIEPRNPYLRITDFDEAMKLFLKSPSRVEVGFIVNEKWQLFCVMEPHEHGFSIKTALEDGKLSDGTAFYDGQATVEAVGQIINHVAAATGKIEYRISKLER
jgi:hypothetical protein